jgi:hypothetical protein
VAQPPREHIGEHRQAIHQVVLLPDKTDVAAKALKLFLVHARDVLAVQNDLARRCAFKAIDAAQQRRAGSLTLRALVDHAGSLLTEG